MGMYGFIPAASPRWVLVGLMAALLILVAILALTGTSPINASGGGSSTRTDCTLVAPISMTTHDVEGGIEVRWTMPESSSDHCDIVGFSVIASGELGSIERAIESSDASSYTFSDLPSGAYEFSLHVKYGESSPLPQTSKSLAALSDCSVELKAEKFETYHVHGTWVIGTGGFDCEAGGIFIEWKKSSANVWESYREPQTRHLRLHSYIAAWLNEGSYDFRVRAVDARGVGRDILEDDWIHTSNVVTVVIVEGPTGLGTVSDARGVIRLGWEPYGRLASLSGYKIRYRRGIDFRWRELDVILPPNSNSYFMFGLEPETQYYWEVAAVGTTDDGNKETLWSKIKGMYLWDEDPAVWLTDDTPWPIYRGQIERVFITTDTNVINASVKCLHDVGELGCPPNVLVSSNTSVAARSLLQARATFPSLDHRLVGNTGQVSGESASLAYDHVQHIRSGNHPHGYVLTGLDLELRSSAATTPTIEVTISEINSARESIQVGKLSQVGLVESATKLVRFDAPADGIGLDPDTQYYVTVDVTSNPSDDATIGTTTSSVNDVPGDLGWVINDRRVKRQNGDTLALGNTERLKLRLHGSRRYPQPIVSPKMNGVNGGDLNNGILLYAAASGGDGEMTVSWDPIKPELVRANKKVTSYAIRYQKKGSDPVWVQQKVNPITHRITDLDNGEYKVWVHPCANNASSNVIARCMVATEKPVSSGSEETVTVYENQDGAFLGGAAPELAVTLAEASTRRPRPPDGVSARRTTNRSGVEQVGQLTVEWRNPKPIAGEAAIDHYRVRFTEEGVGEALRQITYVDIAPRIPLSVRSRTNSYSYSGLVSGRAYSIAVQAHNVNGASAWVEVRDQVVAK